MCILEWILKSDRNFDFVFGIKFRFDFGFRRNKTYWWAFKKQLILIINSLIKLKTIQVQTLVWS